MGRLTLSLSHSLLMLTLMLPPQVCNFTNAVFFYCFLPETAKRPLEEMRYLFTEAPHFVPTMDRNQAYAYDLERRVEEVEQKQAQGDLDDLAVEDRRQ